MYRLLTVILCAAMGVFAAFPYNGTVKDIDGKPIASARLIARNTADTTFTDSNGVFGEKPTSNAVHSELQQYSPTIRNGILSYMAEASSAIHASFYNVCGQVIANVNTVAQKSGLNILDIAPLGIGAGVYIGKIRIGKTVYIVKSHNINKFQFSAGNGGDFGGAVSAMKKSRNSTNIDSLKVSADGFIDTTVAADSGVIAVMMRKNPAFIMPGGTMNVSALSGVQANLVQQNSTIEITTDETQINTVNSYSLTVNQAAETDSAVIKVSFAVPKMLFGAGEYPLLVAVCNGDTQIVASPATMKNMDSLSAEFRLKSTSGLQLSKRLLIPKPSFIQLFVLLMKPINEDADVKEALKDMQFYPGGNANTDTVLFFVHGINSNYKIWDPLVQKYGSQFGTVCVDYDTWRHISSNGKALNAKLASDPLYTNKVKIFITHSMGGLVTRKALAEGFKSSNSWVSKTKKLILFSSPSDGGQLPYLFLPTILFDITNEDLNVFGAADLKYGYMNEADWNAPDAYSVNRKTPVLLPPYIEAFATVSEADRVVSIGSAFDTEDGKDDLHLGQPVPFVASANFSKNHAVIIPGQKATVLEFRRAYDITPAGLDVVDIYETDNMPIEKEVIEKTLPAHSTYVMAEGQQLLSDWIMVTLQARITPLAPLVKVGQYIQLKAELYNPVTGATVPTGETWKWSTSDNTVASCPVVKTSTTAIEGKKAGTAIITAIDSVSGEIAKDTITVQDSASNTDTGTVTDIDGNVYHTVKIGNQIWMVENLKTTKYNDNTAISYVPDSAAWYNLYPTGSTIGAYCFYKNISSTKWGALYNWYAVCTGKLAPDGWHVPTDAEWDTLEYYLIANGYNWDGTTTYNKITKSMAAKTDWSSCNDTGTIGNDLSKNNASGFSALPGGCRGPNGNFYSQSDHGFWWSATESGASSAYDYQLNYFSEAAGGSFNNKSCGFSVRLLRDSN
jgi:uncharacterized protein (TIGR02145 family)